VPLFRIILWFCERLSGNFFYIIIKLQRLPLFPSDRDGYSNGTTPRSIGKHFPPPFFWNFFFRPPLSLLAPQIISRSLSYQGVMARSSCDPHPFTPPDSHSGIRFLFAVIGGYEYYWPFPLRVSSIVRPTFFAIRVLCRNTSI